MANKKKTELEEMEPTLELPKTDLTHYALGMYEGTDGWYVATLKFDPVSGQSTVVDRTLAGEDKSFAFELFRLKTVDLNII